MIVQQESKQRSTSREQSHAPMMLNLQHRQRKQQSAPSLHERALQDWGAETRSVRLCNQVCSALWLPSASPTACYVTKSACNSLHAAVKMAHALCPQFEAAKRAQSQNQCDPSRRA